MAQLSGAIQFSVDIVEHDHRQPVAGYEADDVIYIGAGHLKASATAMV
jgi:hypothetical protein